MRVSGYSRTIAIAAAAAWLSGCAATAPLGVKAAAGTAARGDKTASVRLLPHLAYATSKRHVLSVPYLHTASGVFFISYQLYDGGSPVTAELDHSTDSSNLLSPVTFSNLAHNHHYQVAVQATDSSGNASPLEFDSVDTTLDDNVHNLEIDIQLSDTPFDGHATSTGSVNNPLTGVNNPIGINVKNGSLRPDGFTHTVPNAAGFAPGGVATDGSELYIADPTNHVIWSCPADGASPPTVLVGTLGTSGYVNGKVGALFNTPNDIVYWTNPNVPADHFLFVADSGNHCIRKIDLGDSNNVSTLAGPDPGVTPNTGCIGAETSGYTAGNQALFNDPAYLATAPGDWIYVSDVNNNRIRKVDATLGTTWIVAGDGAVGQTNNATGLFASFEDLHGLAETPEGELYVLDHDEVRSVSVNLQSTNPVNLVAGDILSGSADGVGTSATFTQPSFITSDPGGFMYVSEPSSNRIRVVDSRVASHPVTTLAGGSPGSTDGFGAAAQFNNPLGMVYTNGFLFVGDTGNNTMRTID